MSRIVLRGLQERKNDCNWTEQIRMILVDE